MYLWQIPDWQDKKLRCPRWMSDWHMYRQSEIILGGGDHWVLSTAPNRELLGGEVCLLCLWELFNTAFLEVYAPKPALRLVKDDT